MPMTYRECRGCGGKGCKACGQTGQLPRAIYKTRHKYCFLRAERMIASLSYTCYKLGLFIADNCEKSKMSKCEKELLRVHEAVTKLRRSHARAKE